MTRIFFHALPQVLLPGRMLIHHRNLRNEPALKDGAQELFLAFEMPKESDLVDLRFSGDFAGGGTSDAIPGEGFGRRIEEAFTRRIDGRKAWTFPQNRRG